MLQISEKIGHEKRRFWNNYQHFMKRGYTQLFIKKGTREDAFFSCWLLALGFRALARRRFRLLTSAELCGAPRGKTCFPMCFVFFCCYPGLCRTPLSCAG
jgi:hypothetical protein